MSNGSLLELKVRAQQTYNSTWYAYASSYYGLGSETVPVLGLRMNGTFVPSVSGTFLIVNTSQYIVAADLPGYYKTDALGVVTRPLAKTLTAGNYELKAQFKGDAAYLGEIVETPFAVGLP